ncbi:hypothetical protein Hdeb2414_s0293g00859171 [Helianthus debilis subsp. tardiflorus]
MLTIILAVGTKLQAILTKMALEITERHAVVQGIPLVQASDKHFWFSTLKGEPNASSHTLRFVSECFPDYLLPLDLGNKSVTFVDMVGVLILCSYITLPLYALLSQMGSSMKKSIFYEQTARALTNWRMAVKRKHRGKDGKSPTRSVASSLTASPVHSFASPISPTTAATVHRFKTTGHSTHSAAYEDTDASDFEAEPPSPESSTRHLIDPRVDYHNDHEIKLDLSTQQEIDTRSRMNFHLPSLRRGLNNRKTAFWSLQLSCMEMYDLYL